MNGKTSRERKSADPHLSHRQADGRDIERGMYPIEGVTHEMKMSSQNEVSHGFLLIWAFATIKGAEALRPAAARGSQHVTRRMIFISLFLVSIFPPCASLSSSLGQDVSPRVCLLLEVAGVRFSFAFVFVLVRPYDNAYFVRNIHA